MKKPAILLAIVCASFYQYRWF